MKALFVLVIIFLVTGVAGLWLASNQQYMLDEEYLSEKYFDERGIMIKLPPHQAKSQQQFNFSSGVVFLTIGLIMLIGITILKIRPF